MAYHRIVALLPDGTQLNADLILWVQERVLQGYRLEYCSKAENGSIEVAMLLDTPPKEEDNGRAVKTSDAG